MLGSKTIKIQQVLYGSEHRKPTMRFLLYNPTFFDDLEGLKLGQLDHFGALWGLAPRTDLWFWGPDPTKSEIQELSNYFFSV